MLLYKNASLAQRKSAQKLKHKLNQIGSYEIETLKINDNKQLMSKKLGLQSSET